TGDRSRPSARTLRARAVPDRGAGGAAVPGGPGRPVDAGRQPGQVAPGPYDLVLRDLPAPAAPPGLRTLRSRVRVSVQLLLRAGRRTAPAARAGLAVAPRRCRDRALPRACRRGDAATDRARR